MFPTRFPLYTYLALALSLAVAAGSFLTWKQFAPALQIYYLTSAGHYVYETTALPRFSQKPDRFIVISDGQYMATIDTPLTAMKAVAIRTTAKALHESLAGQVYGGSIVKALRIPIWISGIFGLLALIAGSATDGKIRRSMRDGVLIRGPQLITPRAYNRKTKGNGIEIELA